MGTHFIDLDIEAKLPIIKAESINDAMLNGIESNNHHYTQNGVPNNNNNNNSNHNKNHNSNNPNANNHQVELPKPSFRFTENRSYKKRSHTLQRHLNDKSLVKSKDSYYHYVEPSPEELLSRVEYDMDEQDAEWLKIFNGKHGAKYNYEVSEGDFEKIMDRLEKESYFESKKSGREIVPEVDEDAVCAICDDGNQTDANLIMFCDMCDLAVHQECYGVPYVPEGQWLCRRCLQSPSRNVECVLCPNKGGAFKQTDDNRWAHVICALWVPEVCFANTVFLEPIDSIDQIPSARWKLTCYICKQKKRGACIQCHKPNCYVPFHVTCAQQAGLYLKIRRHRYETPEGSVYDVIKQAFCDAHEPKDGKNRGGGMYSGDESDDESHDTQAYKKWKQAKREKMRKTRKILAEKRVTAFNPISEPKVEDNKLIEISKLLALKGKRKADFDQIRTEFIRQIKGYWLLKRNKRNGVPLLRRLQVSYNKTAPINLDNLDDKKYSNLRYDLEKARLLVGEVKKRETMKKRMITLSRDIINKQFDVIDQDSPPNDDQ